MAKKEFCSLDLTKGKWEFEVPENYKIGEAPNQENSTKLHQILIQDVDKKYYLSQKACEGILRRAKQRGKELPEILENALISQAKEIRKKDESSEDKPCFALDQQGGKGQANYAENICPTILSDSHGTPHAVAYPKAYGVTTKGNGDAFVNDGTHTSLSAGGGQAGQGYPCAMVAAFRPEPSAKIGSISYKEEQSPTLLASGVPAILKKPSNDSEVETKNNQNEFEMGFSQNQREEVRNIGNKAVSLTAEQGMHQQNFLTFRKTSHAKEKNEGQGWQDTEINDTLNVFDQGEMRTPTLVADKNGGGGDLSATLLSSYGTKWNGIAGAYSGENFVLSFEPGAASRIGGHVDKEVSSTLRADMGDNRPSVVLNDQGGNSINIEKKEISPTIRAQDHGHPPVLALKNKPMVKVIENHANDSRFKLKEDEIVQTLSSRMGTGGNNEPMVLEDYSEFIKYLFSLTTGSYMSVSEEKANTLQARDYKDPQVIAYGISSYDSNGMKSDNPNVGFYETDTTRTLDLNGGNPSCNQGGIAVVEGNGIRPSHKGNGYKESNVMYTLNTVEQHAIAFSDKSATLSAGDGPKGPSSQMLSNPTEHFVCEEIENLIKNNNAEAKHQQDLLQSSNDVGRTLAAGTHGSAPHLTKTVVNEENKYYIRRLTPTECARLQNFPDWWCKDLGEDNPTQEEIEKWKEIFETHRKVITKGKKKKQKNT